MADERDRLMDTRRALQGAKSLWASEDRNDRLAFYKSGSGAIAGVVCNPNKPPVIIHLDGTSEELTWFY